MGVFDYIRRTHFSVFIVYWLAGIVVFGILYSVLGSMSFSDALYSSLLIATIFGFSSMSGLAVLSYIQLVISAIIVLILLDKIYIKFVHPVYHKATFHEKKINTLMLMMSIFRNDISKMMSSYKSSGKAITIKDIEAVIDGLYVVFLDVEKLFSKHKDYVKKVQYQMLSTNIEESLEMLEKFILFLEHHKVEWKDKNTEFWMRYIVDSASNIVESIDTSHIKNPKVIIAMENIREYCEKIQARI